MDKDNCTMWPEGVWSYCCNQHDLSAGDKGQSWVKTNYWLAACVHASSYSPKVTSPFWRYIARYVAPPLMFAGTSTVGWYFRFKAVKGGAK